MTRRIRLLIYGLQGAAQYQMIAGSAEGLRDGQEYKIRSLAYMAANAAADSSLPAGTAARVGSSECYTLALPTGTREAMSGRPGIGVSFVILNSRGITRTEPQLLTQALAGMELALAAALPTKSVDLRSVSELLAHRLQKPEDWTVGETLTAHVAGTERVFDAVAQHLTPVFRRRIPASAPTNVKPERIEYCLLDTLIRGLRTTRKAQQSLILRLGHPDVPALTVIRAHRFMGDHVILSQDAPAAFVR